MAGKPKTISSTGNATVTKAKELEASTPQNVPDTGNATSTTPQSPESIAVQNAGSDVPNMADEIPCESVVYGGLTWVSPKTGCRYRWEQAGNTEYIPYSDLITMHNANSAFLTTPMIRVLDERVMKKFRLGEIYARMDRINALPSVANQGVEAVQDTVQDALKHGMRDYLIAKVRAARNDGLINNIDVIQYLERELRFDILGNKPFISA